MLASTSLEDQARSKDVKVLKNTAMKFLTLTPTGPKSTIRQAVPQTLAPLKIKIKSRTKTRLSENSNAKRKLTVVRDAHVKS